MLYPISALLLGNSVIFIKYIIILYLYIDYNLINFSEDIEKI